MALLKLHFAFKWTELTHDARKSFKFTNPLALHEPPSSLKNRERDGEETNRMDVDYISATGGVMSFTKLRLRMERQRNSTSHQNILPSTAPLLRNTRSSQDSVINKLPTLLEVLMHKHSQHAPLEQQQNKKLEDKAQPVIGLEGRVQSVTFTDGGSMRLREGGIICSFYLPVYAWPQLRLPVSSLRPTLMC